MDEWNRGWDRREPGRRPRIEVEWENYVIACAATALAGLVSDPISGVSIDIRADSVVVFFAVTENETEVSDDIDDFLGDLEALIGPHGVEIEHRVYVGVPGPNWDGHPHHRVFERKRRPSTG